MASRLRHAVFVIIALFFYVSMLQEKMAFAEPEAKRCIAVKSQIEERGLFPKFANTCQNAVNVLYCCNNETILDCAKKGWGAGKVNGKSKDAFFGCKDMSSLSFDACFDPQWPLIKGAKVIGTKMAAPCSRPYVYRPEIVKTISKPEKLKNQDKLVVKKITAPTKKQSAGEKAVAKASKPTALVSQTSCDNPYGGPNIRNRQFLCREQGFIYVCLCNGGSCKLQDTGSQLCTRVGAIID